MHRSKRIREVYVVRDVRRESRFSCDSARSRPRNFYESWKIFHLLFLDTPCAHIGAEAGRENRDGGRKRIPEYKVSRSNTGLDKRGLEEEEEEEEGKWRSDCWVGS